MAECVLAADLGGTKLALAAVDGRGRIRERRSERVDTSSVHAPAAQILRIANDLSARVGEFGAAAVAVPGLVRRNGTVWAPNLRGWESVPLARMLCRKLRIPVVVESDRNAAVLGEAWRGAARGKPDVIVLIAGTGIGAGILSGGRLVRGAHELSGCAGWMAVSDRNGAEVRRFGGLEAFASGAGIARAARKVIRSGYGAKFRRLEELTAERVAELARAGDRTAKQIWQSAGRQLGLAVANLISLFDPEVVVFGGGMAGAADLFWDELTRTALARCQPLAAKQVQIRLSKLGGDANLLGCARLAWDAVEKHSALSRQHSARGSPSRNLAELEH